MQQRPLTDIILSPVPAHELAKTLTAMILAGVLPIIEKKIQQKIERIAAGEEMYSRREAAKYLYTSLVTLDKMVKNGKLLSFRVSGRIVFRKTDLDAVAAKMRKPIVVE